LSKPPLTPRERAEESGAAELTTDERNLVEGKPTSIAKAAAAAAVRDAKSKAARSVPQIQRGDIALVEFKQNDWSIVAAHGAQPEDYDLKPEMWALVSDMVHAYDLIRVVARDESWWAMYLVLSAGTSRANAKLIMAADLPARDAESEGSDLPDGYDVRPGNPAQDPWLVIRLADAMIMNVGQGHRTREDARRWLLDHAVLRRSTY
jgi:hypothetical protein